MAALAAGALLWGMAAGPASADNIRAGQWALTKYEAESKVWPVSQGDGVVVAVIDTGVSADHQDLTGQVVSGVDYSNAQGDGRTDTEGHGTGMASLIAGHGHGDQAGVMGLAPKAKILPVRIKLSGDGDFVPTEDHFSEALRYAVDHGAKVVNMSFGGGVRTNARAREALSYALSKDVVLVASTGNLGNHATPVAYPAAFPGVIAVGAVDQNGQMWEKSSYGPETTVVAPGVDIYSADIKSTSAYRNANGTSDSTAYVSAIAALVRSKYPNLSAGQVINRIIKSAVAPPDGSAVPNDHYGYGIASPSKALAANPAVDNGPKENPLLSRPESQGSPDSPDPVPTGDAKDAAAKDGSGVPVYVYVLAGVLGLLVVVGVAVLIVRGRKNGGSGPPPPSGGGGYGPPAPSPYGQPPTYEQPPTYGQAPQAPYGGVQQQPYGYPQGPPAPPSGPPVPPSGQPYR
ncbi:type VII secretion-associated serine protease mycosin [Kitasatospora sp. NBC_00240]|uniref:type VII secretion-associated serine protease mycosin n=1 Tax=Kitasatospora sp. NBC_00240 TaxID=2903567 RepID=UPI00224F37B5|nr:type VII secretion-associated serine protease mycosin [Kitasatospora sp. NBC_00240]MCX5212693.1 type VII secretion-associated serine protease mycosin [Kitasatospora sp. NBC_00240]